MAGITNDLRNEVESMELANKQLKKALEIAANQLEGMAMTFETHGTNLNLPFLIEHCRMSAHSARLAVKLY